MRSKEGPGREGRTGHFLVTYLPVNGTKPTKTGKPTRVRVFATPYYPGKKITSSDRKRKSKDTILGWHWYDLGSITSPETVKLVVDHAALFGVAIEDDVRKLFQDEVLKKLWKKKKTSYGGGEYLHGADIYWTELARFYDELARELGDPFYAELASELASLGREAARWDAA